jgi:hypothetical protein
LDTKVIDENKQTIKKEYNGRLIISKPQTSCYCILSNPRIGEVCMLSFYHRYFFTSELHFRLANVLTTSAGDNRRPTIHRMLLSRTSLSEDVKNMVKAGLLLNNSEIIIREDSLDEIKKELPPALIKLLDRGDIQKTQFYCIPEAKIDSINIPREAKAKAILNLRSISIAERNNRIGHKADDVMYDYLSNAVKNEE